MKKKEILILVGAIVLFLVFRLPGINKLYHQDEYKWPIIVNPSLTEPGGIPHPPVGEFIYRELGALVGYDHFRIIPLIFAFLNLFLLFYLVKHIADTKTALWSAFIFAISFYSVLASLMVDTDGAIMPFFLLLSLIAYFRSKKNWKWIFLLVPALTLGFFVKASFIIAIGAIVLDFAIERGAFKDKKKLLKYSLLGIAVLILLALLLWLSQAIFTSFRLEWTLKYWKGFVRLHERGWLQTFIQFAKSILYISPLLILPIFFMDRGVFKKTRVLILFIGLGLIFYLLLFDFSAGALDRYFQFLVVPLSIISGIVFSRLKYSDFKSKPIIILLVVLLVIFFVQFVQHFVPPHYPKTEWLERVFSLKWNFLFPFTGGSGPTGFYISFLFIAIVWLTSIVFIKKRMLLAVLVLGLLYNAVFIEEYLFGNINGSPYKLFNSAKAFIQTDENIKNIVVYNDIGGYEIQKMGKYERRLYAAPQFEETYRKFFKDFSGHVLYINIPKIEEGSFYDKYLASCRSVYEDSSHYIEAKIYDCHKDSR